MSASFKTTPWDILAEPSGLPGCVTTTFCPCLTYGVLLQHLEGAPADVYCAGQCVPAGALFCGAMAIGCPCLVHIPTRQHLRTKYGIKAPENGLVEDFLCTWCCSPCLLCQEYNEVQLQSGATTDYFTDLSAAANKSSKEVQASAKKAVDNAKAPKPAAATADAPVTATPAAAPAAEATPAAPVPAAPAAPAAVTEAPVPVPAPEVK